MFKRIKLNNDGINNNDVKRRKEDEDKNGEHDYGRSNDNYDYNCDSNNNNNNTQEYSTVFPPFVSEWDDEYMEGVSGEEENMSTGNDIPILPNGHLIDFNEMEARNMQIHHLVDNIYMGNVYTAQDPAHLTSNYIKHVMLLIPDEEAKWIKFPYLITFMKYMSVPLKDTWSFPENAPEMQSGVDAFFSALKKVTGKERVLLACSSGLVRTCAMAIAYLMKIKEIKLDNAFDIVNQALEYKAVLTEGWKNYLVTDMTMNLAREKMLGVDVTQLNTYLSKL